MPSTSFVVNYPIRNLYSVPNSSVRYLDMYRKYENGHPNTIDDIIIVPQMTFSCKIEHLFQILKKITEMSSIQSSSSKYIVQFENTRQVY